MTTAERHILLTGSTGGIGSAMALRLATPTTRLTLLARNPERLRELAAAIDGKAASIHPILADLTESAVIEPMVAAAIERHGPIDILINNAAVNNFGLFEQASANDIQHLLATNLVAPMLLTRAALPHMLARSSGQIVNIGSLMGSIGFAGFATYCSGKFALRGFSEALRRELSVHGIRVTYVAPRYTRTTMNSAIIDRVAREVGMTIDDPAEVAGQIIAAIDGGKRECFIGRPERFFARLNGLFPSLVDRGLSGSTRTIRKIAAQVL